MRRLCAVLCLASIFFQPLASAKPWAASQPLSALTGLNLPANWKELAPWKDKFLVDESELPGFFDWRFYANELPPVKRQLCQDCWAQGTVGVLESLIKIHLGLTVDLSVQEVISCSGRGTCARGGYFAHSYHQSRGAVGEDQFPYVARDTKCKTGLRPEYAISRWGYVGSKDRAPSVAQIKQAMLEHGPVAATVRATSALSKFTGEGVFKSCTSGSTNHIVVIVGWDDNDKAWIMRNSWGADWGYRGYAKIPYGCLRLGEMATWAELRME